MRVILDISMLGLGVLHPETRGGAFRADEHLVEELALSNECELAFCANHSTLTYNAAIEYVRANPLLARYPMLGPPSRARRSLLRRGMTTAYGWIRRIFPRGSLPGVVRAVATLVDRRVHPVVTDAPGGADIFHSTYFALPPRQRGRSPQRFLTIYDLRYRRLSELYDPRSRAVAEEILESIGPGDWVITTSQASRDELIASGVAEAHQVFVVPLAADRDLFYPCIDIDTLRNVRTRYGIGDAPYILSVSSIDIRKNMHQAVRAFARLVRQENVGDLKFVIAGAPGSGSPLLTSTLAEAADVSNRIIHTGFVDDADLAPLYSGATAFLFLSIDEGFGLPPLEAMQCGTPVISSNSSSLPEVVGDAARTVHPNDLDAICGALLEVLTDSALRASLSQKALARAAEFTWQRTAAGVLAAYRTALAAR